MYSKYLPTKIIRHFDIEIFAWVLKAGSTLKKAVFAKILLQ